MSEEREAEGATLPGASTADPAALALGLNAASREKADAFLDDQRTLTANQNRMLHLQMEEMRAEEPYKLSHFRLRRFSDYAKAAFELSIGLIALALVGGLAAMVWSAAHSDGLIVEGFAVPPEMTQKGFSGEVIASQLLDKLIRIQSDSTSARPSKSYANSWGDDLKVEIPETGISVGEVYRFLRGWLGHETRISGEITRTESGIALTARIGGADGATYAGPESNLDSLVQQSAEHIYRVTQPDRYARYLYINANTGGLRRFDEARDVLNRVIATAPPLDKASAIHALALLDGMLGDTRAYIAEDRQALAWNPDGAISYATLVSPESDAGQSEAALATAKSCLRVMSRSTVPDISADAIPGLKSRCQITIAALSGDFAAVPGLVQSVTATRYGGAREPVYAMAAAALAGQHDRAAARTYLNTLPPTGPAVSSAMRAIARLQVEAGLENWQGIIAQETAAEVSVRATKGYLIQIGTVLRPWLAYAQAMTGHPAAAHALIDRTPGDCDLCLRTRGKIDAAESNYGGADFWFARAVRAAPSIPFAYADWGQSLLVRSKPDEAIAQFKLANQKGPHFADPPEGWGEALMAKNQSHLALAKFAEAEKYAPNWGRLHLKWGEALVYSGKRAEAKQQFARAGALDLTPSEKSELTKVSHG